MNSRHVFYFRLWLAPALNHWIESGLCASIFDKKGPPSSWTVIKSTPNDFMLFTSPVPRPGRLGNKKMPLATRAFKDNTFLDVIVQEKASEWNASHRAERVKCLRNGRNTTTLFSSHIAVVVCFLFLMYQSQRTIVIKPVY